MDKKSLNTLEFNKILRRLAAYTSFSGGEDLALNLHPTTDIHEARRWQQETREAYGLLNSGSDITIGGARDVRPAVDRAGRSITLLPADFLDIRNTLIAARNLQRKIDKVRERYPMLGEIADLIEDAPGLVADIGDTLDERGDVLDSASPKLAKTRQQLRTVHGRIQDKLRSIISGDASKYLQEAIITQRNGRYVVPVRSESRGNVKGIVHDQSGSGATVWVEPMQTVELNNEFRSLQIEEEKEIHRILSALTIKVADQGDIIIRIVDRVAEFDLIFARAKYAGDINAIEPEFVPWRKNKGGDRHPGCNVWVKGARHPLLDPSTVIPTDLTLPEDVFMVLITGPNTGGKTVSLKTLGLMVLMAQSGMHLPATEARLTIFNDVFADIGDEQSIEQSLSTFSGHMTNITRILAEVDERTLVLLDELGSGTDPAEGAALAQSIIEFLRDKGTTTFTATHYPELKAYATRTEGATNASLIFDIDTLSPTYEMTIGIPGKSNALAIARRLGLDNSILDDAMRLLGTESSETETLLDSIYDMREKISSEEAAIRLERKRIERDRKKLEQQLSDIEPERQRIVEETRAQMAAELDEVRREIQQVRRRLSDAQSKNTLKQLSRNVQEIEEQPREKMELSPIVEPSEPARKRKLKVGDTVLVKTINTKGDVLSIDGDEVSVAIGRLHLKAKLDELEFKGRPVSNEEPLTTGTVSVPRAESPGLELDIRGRRVEDGLSELDKYLDRAFLARMPWVRIIHGKGTGKLRHAVRKALSKHNRILSWEEGLDGEGGAGVTVAKLEEVPQES